MITWFQETFLRMDSADLIWIGIGFFGQFLFSMRFLYQWFQSERVKKSVIPITFWYFSIAGGLTLLTYAIRQQDPVIICGQAGGLIIYVRNLWLIFEERKRLRMQQMDGVPAE